MREGTAALLRLDERIEVVGLAADGAEAISLAERRAPDVALLDLGMPRVNGIEACAILRERFPGIEVMILTPFCLINIDEGLKELDAEVTEMGRSFTRSRARMLTKIVLPLLAPYLVAAVRMSYGVGWKLALVAELFGSTTGLGFLMLQAQTIGDAATVFATCFTIVLMFVLGERLLIDPLSRRFSAKA